MTARLACPLCDHLHLGARRCSNVLAEIAEGTTTAPIRRICPCLNTFRDKALGYLETIDLIKWRVEAEFAHLPVAPVDPLTYRALVTELRVLLVREDGP